MFSRLKRSKHKEPPAGKPPIPEKKIHKVVNFTPIKDFTSFGLNKTLINLKIQKLADIKTRETLMGKKESRDWIKLMTTIMLIAIIGAVVFMVVTQMLGVSEHTQQIYECNRQLGECLGKLASGAVSGTGGGATIPG